MYPRSEPYGRDDSWIVSFGHRGPAGRRHPRRDLGHRGNTGHTDGHEECPTIRAQENLLPYQETEVQNGLLTIGSGIVPTWAPPSRFDMSYWCRASTRSRPTAWEISRLRPCRRTVSRWRRKAPAASGSSGSRQTRWWWPSAVRAAWKCFRVRIGGKGRRSGVLGLLWGDLRSQPPDVRISSNRVATVRVTERLDACRSESGDVI